MEKCKVLAVVGPTASGKTALGVQLAKRYDGEVISADSMQIYEGLDIASAKPTAEEMQGIPHHLISVIPRTQRFSVADYAELAHATIQEVAGRGKLPVLIGGTGLYIDAVLSGMQFAPEEESSVRSELTAQLQTDGKEALHARLAALDPEAAAAIHPNNTVRVIRALEVCLTSGRTFTQYKKENAAHPSPYEACILGLDWDREVLYKRIDQRVLDMVDAGLVEEAEMIYRHTAQRVLDMMKQGLYEEAMTLHRTQNFAQTSAAAIGYKELIPYFEQTESLARSISRIQMETRRYAKRQLTWFRRNAQIHWLKVCECDKVREILEKAEKIIAKSDFL